MASALKLLSLSCLFEAILKTSNFTLLRWKINVFAESVFMLKNHAVMFIVVINVRTFDTVVV